MKHRIEHVHGSVQVELLSPGGEVFAVFAVVPEKIPEALVELTRLHGAGRLRLAAVADDTERSA